MQKERMDLGILFFELLLTLSLSVDYELLSPIGKQTTLADQQNRLQKVCDHLVANLESKICVTALAEMVGLTNNHFGHLFKQTYGLNAIDFAHKLRIQKACHLLQHSRDSITVIAYDCGFESVAYFGKQFRRFMNVSAKEYREEVWKTVGAGFTPALLS